MIQVSLSSALAKLNLTEVSWSPMASRRRGAERSGGEAPRLGELEEYASGEGRGDGG